MKMAGFLIVSIPKVIFSEDFMFGDLKTKTVETFIQSVP